MTYSFGENKQLFVLFYQLLVDRYVASDCDGQLVQDILSVSRRHKHFKEAKSSDYFLVNGEV